jgi:acyl-coenzyme A thioesterase PaaI-like protein
MATRTEIAAFPATGFPQTQCSVEAVGAKAATVRHPVGADELRPGGTVAGPVLMAVADVALYSEGTDAPMAHVAGTYAIPCERSR